MTDPKEQQEPSMEEILSSIRRIIADEEAEEGKADEEAAAARSEDELSSDEGEEGDDGDDDDVLELTRVVRDSGEVVDLNSDEAAMAAAEDGDLPEESRSPADEPDADEAGLASRETSAQSTEHETNQEEQAAVSAHQDGAEALLSDAAATAATGAFAKLSHAFQRTPEEEAVADDQGRTIEQFVEDMLRPMLKAWMDENLPPIVERLVQKEIQKMARRAELI